MKKTWLFCLLIFPVFLLPAKSIAGDDDKGNRFLNVKQWKGTLDVRINTTFTKHDKDGRAWSEETLNSERVYRIQLQTVDGIASGVDPLVAETEPEPGGQVEKGDLFEKIDFSKMQQAMKRSGVDPATLGMIMGEMDKMKGLHISGNKYMQWSDLRLKSNATGSWNETHLNKGKYEAPFRGMCTYRHTRKTNGKWTGAGSINLFVNLQKQAYSFTWGAKETGGQKATWNHNKDDSCYPSESETREVSYESYLPENWAVVKFESLPTSGLSLSGQKQIVEERADGKKDTVTLQWAFSPAEQEDIPEAWVEYNKQGKDWLPEDDNTVKATLNWGENVIPAKVRFTLYDISAEPGISLNSEDKNTESDLEFAEENSANGFEISQSGKSYIAIKEALAGHSESIVLHAKDFGAYGKMKAEINVGGSWFTATAKPFDLPYLPVPYDENNNLIADKWEKDVGVYKLDLQPNWDEDPFPSYSDRKKHNGDGFTLYEEYRGFQEIGHVFKKGDNEQVKNGHVRMDPMYKDIFILDSSHLFFEFYRPYNPAALNWHLISPAMMKQKGSIDSDPDYRWVNFNTSKNNEHFLRNQYALVLVDGGAMRESAGITFGLDSCGVNPAIESAWLPLKCNYKVAVYRTFIARFVRISPFPKDKGEVLQDILTTTVIHELGHAMGIIHHTHETFPEYCKAVPLNDRGGTPCDPNTYGLQSCAMRYEDSQENKNSNIIPLLKTSYCREGQSYITSEADDSGNFKQYPSHDCYGQINIKGD